MSPAARQSGDRARRRQGAGCLMHVLLWGVLPLSGDLIHRNLGWPYVAAFALLLLLAGAVIQVRQIHRRGQTIAEARAAARAERRRRSAMREQSRQVAALRLNDEQPDPAGRPGVLTVPGYDVVLDSAGNRKIEVIKQVRKLTGLPLKPAKDLVDSAPAAVLRVPDRPTAHTARAILESAGASASVVCAGEGPGRQ